MTPDKLTRLARVRAIETRSATLELASRLAAEASTDTEAELAQQALQSEAAAGSDGFARWLPRGLAERARAHVRAAAATDATAVARAMLARALAGGEVVNEAIVARRQAQTAEATRRAQHEMDERAQRPRASG